MTSVRNFDEIRKDLKNYLTQQQIYDVILDSFDSLKLNKEKVELCWILLCDSVLFPSLSGLNDKSTELSEKFRLEGNHAFASRKDLQAIRSYTLAAGHAQPSSKELVLAVANRSAVSSRLDDHSNCLRDIDFAISRNYPDNLKYKLLERKGKSLLSLGHLKAAESSLKEALASLNLCDLTDSKLEKVKNDITDLLTECSKESTQISSSSQNTDDDDSDCAIIPGLSYGRNKDIPCASNGIDIAYSTDMGRHLVTTRDIYPGDVLAVEKPYVSILLPESAGLYCSHCLTRCHSLLPCSHCTQVYFCSEGCQSVAANRYHRVECGLLKALLGLGCGKLELLAVRTVVEAAGQGDRLTHLVAEAAALDREAPFSPPTIRGFTHNLYQSSSYAAVHCLEGNSHHRSSMDLFRRAVAAACIVELIDSSSSFFKRPSDVGANQCYSSAFTPSHNGEIRTNMFKSFKLLDPYFRQLQVKGMGETKALVGGLLLKYLQVMPSNAHEVSEMLVDRHANTTESVEVGGALYPLLSLINHSCDPNVVRHSHQGDTVALTAIQFIPLGQQVFDNYGYHHAVHDRTYRQTSLMSQYHFYCQCRACLNDWPLYHHMPSSELTCLPGTDVNSIKSSLEKFDKVLTDILSSSSSENLPFLLSHLMLLERGVERPSRELSGCQEAVKQCLSLRANHYITRT